MSRVLICLVALSLVPSSTFAGQVTSGIVGGVVQGGLNGQPPRDTRPATGRSSIRGRVVSADNGEPLRRATVRLSAPEMKGSRTAITGADGRYEFRQLPAGRYSINASKPAFVFWSHGQTHAGSPGKPLVLAENQVGEALDIRLPRGGVIAGRVTDEVGDPVPSAIVTVARLQFVQGQQRPYVGGSTTTNDSGEYRVFGLAPGRYYVSATIGLGFVGTVNDTLEGPDARSGYANTFYPGTAEMAAAQKLTVGAAQTLSGIDIGLLPARMATISGSALDSQGRPLNCCGVSITPRGRMNGLGTMGAGFQPDGTFTVTNVPPGEYVMRANPQRPPGATDGPPDFFFAFVTVNGEDVRDVQLRPVVPGTVSGRVLFDDPGAAQSLKPSAVRVVWQGLNQDEMNLGLTGGPPARMEDDLSFVLKTSASRIALNVNIAAPPSTPGGWRVAAIRVNGQDVTDSGIDVGSRGVSGVEIELTNRRQRISGLVTDARGRAVTDYVALLFSQDRLRWTAAGNRYFSSSRPGDDGGFNTGTLPPGEYYAIALDRADSTEWGDPEFLESLIRHASPFSLASGETKTLALRLFSPQ